MSHDDLSLLVLPNVSHACEVNIRIRDGRPSYVFSQGGLGTLIIVQVIHVNLHRRPGMVGDPWVGYIQVVSPGSGSVWRMPQYGRIS